MAYFYLITSDLLPLRGVREDAEKKPNYILLFTFTVRSTPNPPTIDIAGTRGKRVSRVHARHLTASCTKPFPLARLGARVDGFPPVRWLS